MVSLHSVDFTFSNVGVQKCFSWSSQRERFTSVVLLLSLWSLSANYMYHTPLLFLGRICH